MGRQFDWFKGLVFAIAALILVVACQPPMSESPTPAPEASAATTPIVLNGTGASFPLFIYERIFTEYRQQVDPNLQVNFQPTGSAAGIQQLLSQTVDFGASDVAMTDEEMAQVEAGVVLVPMTAGMVAIAYNLPSVNTGLQLTREALAGIFLGQITQWTDPLIVEANPDVSLPDLPITLVHRSDGSGTTATLTAHLSAISPEWQSQVGAGLNVQWPAGFGIKANAGVSAQIQQAEGAIGYVEYSYAQKLDMAIAALENQTGTFVEPNPTTGATALAAVTLPENLKAFIADPAGAEAYPIVTYSWILAYGQYADADKGNALKQILTWGLLEGQQFSEELGYIPLPVSVVEQAITAVESIQAG
ncbi:MAG: phosphate ABC transporter substrate-binding protein PstS [Leptolyngbya sp. SIOISBB]|nr:phosphate ABC transporter substrate-binding protein PstS [Leptolyngbya sp. SIOISBB]